MTTIRERFDGVKYQAEAAGFKLRDVRGDFTAQDVSDLLDELAVLRSNRCAVHPNETIVPACLACWRLTEPHTASPLRQEPPPEKLIRYGPQFDSDDPQIYNGMGEESLGEWVRFSDVMSGVLAAPPQATDVERQLDILRTALVALVGADGREELEQMEIVLRTAPAPAEDKAAAIDGVHALLATLPRAGVSPLRSEEPAVEK